MRLIAVFRTSVLMATVAVGLIVCSTVIPVLGEETLMPAKSDQTPPMVPSLADVVYQSGSLSQRLEVLKTRIDAVDGLRKMERRLEGAKNQTELFYTRLGAINAEDLQSYQQLAASLILYGAFALSWGLQALLMEKVLSSRQMDTGARLSIVRLVHYALVLVGFLVALSALGFELKNVTIIGGALGVGIGFGMQAIVNNFVSGLILLFERPIKVGDVIQLSDGQQGRVLNLGLRATTIHTFDRAEVVVPNGDLIASLVTAACG